MIGQGMLEGGDMQAIIGIIALLLALPAAATPRFADRSGALPVPHVYDGGWEHFVGGGVAVFDCNGDGLPEIFAAGGTNPARLFVNVTDGPGASCALPPVPCPG